MKSCVTCCSYDLKLLTHAYEIRFGHITIHVNTAESRIRAQLIFRPNKGDISVQWCVAGDLMKEEEVLYWLFHHVDHEEIADVTDEMLGKLIANEPFLAVLFCE